MSVSAIVSAGSAEPGYPNLMVTRQQMEDVRDKITREPYRSLWKQIIRDAERHGQHGNAHMRSTYRWERAFEYAVSGDVTKIGDLRGHFLYVAARPVQPVTNYDWHLAEDAVIFDLIGGSYSAEEQQRIRKYFGGKARKVIQFLKTYRGTQNMMTLQRYNVALLGYTARDQEMIEWALNTEWGFKHSIDSLEDGICGEANAYAIHYVLPGWIAVAEAARNYDETDLWKYQSPDGDSLGTFLDRYIDMAWPLERTGVGDGSLRIASYGDAATSLPMLGAPDDIYLINVPAFNLRSTAGRVSLGAVLEVAYARQNDPKYAWLLSLSPARDHSHERAYLNYTALTHGEDLPPDCKAPPAPSSVWSKAGRAILRGDESPEYWKSGSTAAFLVMNKWYGHGHRDRMNLMFHANGRLLYPDMNVIQYEPQHIGWTRHGIGHNLVLVDRMGPWGGPQTIRNSFSPEVKFVAVTADPSGEVNRFMKKLDVWQTRALALTREYLLDMFWLASQTDKDREYTWVLHGLGRLRSDDLGYFVRPEQPRLNHFKWIQDEQHWHTDTNWSVEWIQQSGGQTRGVTPRNDEWFQATPVGVRMTMLGAKGTEAHIGHGPLGFSASYGVNPHEDEGTLPLALARRTANSAIFTSLHEPFVENSSRLTLRRVAESKETIAVQICGDGFQDFVMSDLGRDAEQREIDIFDPIDRQEMFRYRGFAWLRVTRNSVTARGDLSAFRVHAPTATDCVLNGEPVQVEKDKHGYMAFNLPKAKVVRTNPAIVPEWLRPENSQPGVVAPAGPVVAMITVPPGGVETERFRFINTTAEPTTARVYVQAPAGLKVKTKIELGKVGPKQERDFSIEIEAAKTLTGQVVQVQLTPEVASARGRPLSVPVAVGVCVQEDPQRHLYTAITPYYSVMIPQQYGTIINIEDARGLRRSAVNETGLNHWGFPAAGAPSGDKRIFGLNGDLPGSGQPVKLVERTPNSLSFQRTTPSADANGFPETLHYKFGLDHVAMSVEAPSEKTKSGGPIQLTLGALERQLTARTVLHWSDGDATDFSPDAIGLTYHQYPGHHEPWKRVQWVSIEQTAPFDESTLVIEFPKGSEVQAGTHSQLYFNVKLKSGAWIKMHMLSKERLAAWYAEPDTGTLP